MKIIIKSALSINWTHHSYYVLATFRILLQWLHHLILLLLLVSSLVCAQPGRPFEVISPGDSTEVIDLKNLFNSLVHDLNEQLENQGRFAPGRIITLTTAFDERIARLEILRDALNNQDLVFQIQEDITALEVERDELTGDQEGGRQDQSNRAPNIIAKLNVQLNDVDRALRAAER